MSERKNNDLGLLVARVLIGVVFLVTAYWKFTEIPELTTFLDGRGFPAPGIVAWLIAIVEAVGGVALVVGVRPRCVAMVMGIYLVVATLLVHFDLSDSHQIMQMLKNLGIIGGLIAIWSAPTKSYEVLPDA